MTSFAAIATTLVVLAMAASAPAGVPVASSLLNEGDPYPAGGADHVVTAISNTAVNHAGGYAATVNSFGVNGTLSHVWGEASGGAGANIRTEGTFGTLVQTSFESFYGLDDAGSVAYSASGTGGPVGGFDSVWKDDTPLAVEGDPHPDLVGQWWRFASRPGISADGTPFWIGGITSTQGGNTENRGLFFGATGVPLLLGGDVVPNLPSVLSTSNTVGFDYRFSELATDYIAEVEMVGSTATNNVMVVSGAGLILGGTLVREGALVPVSVGGDGLEVWDNFDFTGITEAGDFFFSGDTDGAAADEFILKNGVIIIREGDVVDGETIGGDIEGAFMNANGDIAYIWDVDGGALEALFLNDRLLLKEGEAVDFDGNGAVDPGAVVAGFTGISSLTLGDRESGSVRAYFTADIDTAGTSSTLDDVEGFYCLEVPDVPTATPLVGAPGAAGSSLAAARPNPFSQRTHIAFTLDRDADAKLTVYDVAGRLVTTLVDRSLPAGEHTAAWDGTSRRGRPAAGGVYFYRLDTESFSQTRKLVYLQGR